MHNEKKSYQSNQIITMNRRKNNGWCFTSDLMFYVFYESLLLSYHRYRDRLFRSHKIQIQTKQQQKKKKNRIRLLLLTTTLKLIWRSLKWEMMKRGKNYYLFLLCFFGRNWKRWAVNLISGGHQTNSDYMKIIKFD